MINLTKKGYALYLIRYKLISSILEKYSISFDYSKMSSNNFLINLTFHLKKNYFSFRILFISFLKLLFRKKKADFR